MNDQELQSTVDKQIKELELLRGYDGADQVVSLLEIKLDLDKKDRPFSFKSKIPSLNNLLNGFEVGELIVISGPSKNGKSSFSKSLTCDFIDEGLFVFWIQFEETMRQFIRGFENVPPQVFVPKVIANNALLWVKSKILEAVLKFDTKVVFIDHLGFIADIARKQDRRIEIDTIIRFFKTLAIELEITIFVVHHITKIDEGTVPSFENLKESSAVYQDSDKVLMIWREFEVGRRRMHEIKYTGDTILSVEMDRREGVYKKSIKLKYINKRFKELYDTRVNKIDYK